MGLHRQTDRHKKANQNAPLLCSRRHNKLSWQEVNRHRKVCKHYRKVCVNSKDVLQKHGKLLARGDEANVK